MLGKEKSALTNDSLSVTAQYGYNCMKYDMQSRDRQDTMSIPDQKKELVSAWHECLTTICDLSTDEIADQLLQCIKGCPRSLEAQ